MSSRAATAVFARASRPQGAVRSAPRRKDCVCERLSVASRITRVGAQGVLMELLSLFLNLILFFELELHIARIDRGDAAAARAELSNIQVCQTRIDECDYLLKQPECAPSAYVASAISGQADHFIAPPHEDRTAEGIIDTLKKMTIGPNSLNSFTANYFDEQQGGLHIVLYKSLRHQIFDVFARGTSLFYNREPIHSSSSSSRADFRDNAAHLFANLPCPGRIGKKVLDNPSLVWSRLSAHLKTLFESYVAHGVTNQPRGDPCDGSLEANILYDLPHWTFPAVTGAPLAQIDFPRLLDQLRTLFDTFKSKLDHGRSSGRRYERTDVQLTKATVEKFKEYFQAHLRLVTGNVPHFVVHNVEAPLNDIAPLSPQLQDQNEASPPPGGDQGAEDRQQAELPPPLDLVGPEMEAESAPPLYPAEPEMKHEVNAHIPAHHEVVGEAINDASTEAALLSGDRPGHVGLVPFTPEDENHPSVNMYHFSARGDESTSPSFGPTTPTPPTHPQADTHAHAQNMNPVTFFYRGPFETATNLPHVPEPNTMVAVAMGDPTTPTHEPLLSSFIGWDISPTQGL